MEQKIVSSFLNISWNNRKLRNSGYFQRQYIWYMLIKDFNAIFGLVPCIKAVCLCFDKTGATDFDINFLKMFSKKDGFLFSSILVGKCFKIFGEGSHSSFFTHVLSQMLAVLAVSIQDKGINKASQLWLVSIFLEYTKKYIWTFFPLQIRNLKIWKRNIYVGLLIISTRLPVCSWVSLGRSVNSVTSFILRICRVAVGKIMWCYSTENFLKTVKPCVATMCYCNQSPKSTCSFKIPFPHFCKWMHHSLTSQHELIGVVRDGEDGRGLLALFAL